MSRNDLYARMARILVGTAADPVKVALEHFGVDWREADTGHMTALARVGRCPKCLQWGHERDILAGCKAGVQ